MTSKRDALGWYWLVTCPSREVRLDPWMDEPSGSPGDRSICLDACNHPAGHVAYRASWGEIKGPIARTAVRLREIDHQEGSPIRPPDSCGFEIPFPGRRSYSSFVFSTCCSSRGYTLVSRGALDQKVAPWLWATGARSDQSFQQPMLPICIDFDQSLNEIVLRNRYVLPKSLRANRG